MGDGDRTLDATPAELARAETLAPSPHGETLAASAPTPPRPSLASVVVPGATIGRYEIVERIGAGGMGVVYRARDPRLDRDIALKLVTTGDVDLTVAQARLEREAQAMAKLSHPNVAVVHDIGAWRDQIYIAMELCPGGSLGAWLRAEARPWRDVLVRLLAAGSGLAAAHRLGLVHRDFKPDNVLIGRDDAIKVCDFGLVRSAERVELAARHAAGGAAMSRDGELIGTPAYMAPEQIAGEPAEAAADQFAFAVSLWEGLTGARPFQPDPASHDPLESLLDTIKSGRRSATPRATRAPARVWAALERALAIEPRKRWPTLQALLDELSAVIAPRRRRLVWWIAGGATAIAAAVVVAALVLAEDEVANRKAQAGALIAKAAVLVAEHRSPEALAVLDQAWELDRDPEVLRLRGDALRLAFQCDAGIKAYDAYITVLGPTKVDPDVRHEIETFRVQCTKFQETAGFDLAAATDPDVLRDNARQLERIGEFEAAILAYARAFEISGDWGLFIPIANAYMLLGDCSAAMANFDIFQQKGSPEAVDTMKAWIASARDACRTGKVIYAKDR